VSYLGIGTWELRFIYPGIGLLTTGHDDLCPCVFNPWVDTVCRTRTQLSYVTCRVGILDPIWHP
jgi:hypothetical protein